MIWVYFALFFTDVNNINIVYENRPLEELNLSEITKAITVLNALVNELKKAQAQGVPLVTFFFLIVQLLFILFITA